MTNLINPIAAINIEETAPVSFIELPQDILDQIVSSLSKKDVLRLSLTSHKVHDLISNSPTIQAHIFQLSFHDSLESYTWNKPHPDWSTISKSRKNSKLYSWGSLTGGRLGYSPAFIHNSGQDDHLSRSGFNQGVFDPIEIPDFAKPVKFINSGGFSFQILTSDGDIYSTGSSWHYGHNSGVGPSVNQDYNELIELARAQENEQRELHRLQQQHQRTEAPPTPHAVNPFQPSGRIRFEDMLSGHGRMQRTRLPPRGNVVRLPGVIGPIDRITGSPPYFNSRPYNIPARVEAESSNEVKKVNVIGDPVRFKDIDSGRAHFLGLTEDHKVYSFDTHQFGIPLKFNVDNKVKKVKAGWDYNLVEFSNKGLAFWRKRDPIAKDATDANVSVVMITNEEVIDFIGLENYVIYIDLKHRVWKYQITDLESNPRAQLSEFEVQLKSLNETAVEPRPIKLSGFFQTFVVFSNIDICLFGKTNDSLEVIAIPELNSTGCIDIQIGDYHLLALLANGTVLSWGLESSMCGCLGLGNETSVISVGGVREGNSLRVTKPTKIETLKNCVGIACGGWQSCAIVNESQL